MEDLNPQYSKAFQLWNGMSNSGKIIVDILEIPDCIICNISVFAVLCFQNIDKMSGYLHFF